MFAVASKCWFSILQNSPDKEDYDVQEYSIQTTLNNCYCFDLFHGYLNKKWPSLRLHVRYKKPLK